MMKITNWPIWLSKRKGIALATLDADLVQAARAEAIMLIDEGV